MIELLILYVLSEREMTMYAVLKAILDNFAAFSRPSFGAVKPALNRLEKDGFIRSRKTFSQGGKLSGYYCITSEGREKLTQLLLEKLSKNPLQFTSNAGIKLSCASYLAKEERKILFSMIKNKAFEHKHGTEEILANDYNSLNFYQRIILDNTIVEYNNLISLVEGLEKEHERNGQ